MAEPVVYECIICGTRANERPPRRCPKCDTPAARFRVVVKGVETMTKGPNGVAKPAEATPPPPANGTTTHA